MRRLVLVGLGLACGNALGHAFQADTQEAMVLFLILAYLLLRDTARFLESGWWR